jgi:hypothetical protein
MAMSKLSTLRRGRAVGERRRVGVPLIKGTTVVEEQELVDLVNAFDGVDLREGT